ncbi:MAG TPA: HD domain-containing protein [Candidatus Xenobia bacterium]
MTVTQRFYQGLLNYHNVEGHGNGGRVPGVQLPPGVDRAHLDGALHDLADYLGDHAPVDIHPLPADPAAAQAMRQQEAAAAHDRVAALAHQNMATALSFIQSPAIAAAVHQAVDAAQPQFYQSWGSPSGKWHPADEMNPGGLALHTLRDVEMGRVLTDYYHVEGQERDEILGALVLHDIQKGGIPWGKFSKEHGPIAEQWLDRVWSDADRKAVPDIPHLVGMHMAQWNYPKPTPPQTQDEQIVSYADYLASMNDTFMRT